MAIKNMSISDLKMIAATKGIDVPATAKKEQVLAIFQENGLITASSGRGVKANSIKTKVINDLFKPAIQDPATVTKTQFVSFMADRFPEWKFLGDDKKVGQHYAWYRSYASDVRKAIS